MKVPVEAHLVHLLKPVFEFETRTIRVGKTLQTRRVRVEKTLVFATARTEESLKPLFDSVNAIWAPAKIEFSLASVAVEKLAAPGDAETVNVNGFLYLAQEFPAGKGVSLLLVRKFASADLGGQAVEEQRVCIVGDVSPATSLAHEFGHLLGLEHEGDIRNLMNAGLSIPNPQLTPSQVRTAQKSALARRLN
jgi:hypothetical protein